MHRWREWLFRRPVREADAPWAAERAEGFARQVVATSPDCIKVLDAEGKLTWMNGAGCELMGVADLTALIGSTWTDFWGGDARVEALAALETARAGGIGRFTGPCATMDGRLKWWDVAVVLMSPDDSRARTLLAVSRDITALRDASAAQQTLFAAESAAQGQATQLRRQRDDLLAAVSHELRAPLQAVCSWAAFLQAESSDAAAAEAGRSIETATLHQIELLDRLLEEPDGFLELALEPVLVESLVREVVDSARASAIAKRITLRVDATPAASAWVSGDAQKLRQVLLNLLTNAIKFTPAGGSVSVVLSATAHTVGIAVKDTGPGIREAFRSRLFERYAQDASAQPVDGASGVGLGLFLVRTLVEAHGGSIECPNQRPGEGATFVVELPRLVKVTRRIGTSVGATKLENDAIGEEDAVDLRGLSIVVATGHMSSANAIATRLRHDGARVVTTFGEEPCLPTAERVHGLVIDADHPAALALIADGEPAQWVVGLTHERPGRAQMRLRQSGCDAVLTLPVRPRELARTIATLHFGTASEV